MYENNRGKELSLKGYINFLKFIDNNTVSYLDIDYKTEIQKHYNGYCELESRRCEFGIDYRFLPALVLHHTLEHYSKKLVKKGYEKINLWSIFSLNFDLIIDRLKSQIGGLDLLCRNHHTIFHDKKYNYPSIHFFLKTLHVEDIVGDSSEVIRKINNLSLDFYQECVNSNKEFNWSKNKINRSLIKNVKKKYVFEFIWGKDYCCPICERVNINDHLCAFVAHHTDTNLFKGEMKKI